jgi:hypothetical protein
MRIVTHTPLRTPFLFDLSLFLYTLARTMLQVKLVDALTTMLTGWFRVDWVAHYGGSDNDPDCVLVFGKLDPTVHYYAEMQLLLVHLGRLYTLLWQIDTDDMLIQNSILHFYQVVRMMWCECTCGVGFLSV